MLSLHTSPLAQPGVGRQRRHERLRARAGVGAGPGRRRLHDLRPALATPTCPTRWSSSPASGSCTSTPVARTCPRRRCPSVVDRFADARDRRTSRARAGRRPRPRQLLAVGRGRAPHQARARAAARHHLPHPRPGQGRGRRRRAGAAGAGRDARSSGAPTPSASAAPRRSSSSAGSTATRPGRIEIVAPGVEHAFFAPGDQRGARRALGLGDRRRCCCSSGGIQPLKGVDVAVRALAALDRPDAVLVIVGGASGARR